MKSNLFKSKFNFSIATILLTACILSCNTPAEKVNNAEENVMEAKQELLQAQDDYKTEFALFKKESAERIAANEKIILEIKNKMATNKKKTNTQYETQILELEAKNTRMKQVIDNYKEDKNEQWQSFKAEFNHDMDELGNSLKSFTEDNKK